MAKYVCLVKLRIEIFAAWKLKHIPRGSNEKVDALAVVVVSLPTKETMLLHRIFSWDFDGMSLEIRSEFSGCSYQR